MTTYRHLSRLPTRNARGGAAGILIVLLLLLAAAGGGGYYLYSAHYKQAPLRSKLASTRMKAEMIRFVHDHISPALYHNLITMDDVLVMMGKEMDRLKRIAKQFPDQQTIINPQAESLGAARQRLADQMAAVAAKIEKIYVSWLVDRTNGIAQIRAQRGVLTRDLANALRGENELLSRIRANADAAS